MYAVLYSSARVVTHTHTHPSHTGGPKRQIFISDSSGGQKSKIKILAGLVSPEACPIGLQMATPTDGRFPHLSLCTCALPSVSFCVLISYDDDTSWTGLGPNLIASF